MRFLLFVFVAMFSLSSFATHLKISCDEESKKNRFLVEFQDDDAKYDFIWVRRGDMNRPFFFAMMPKGSIEFGRKTISVTYRTLSPNPGFIDLHFVSSHKRLVAKMRSDGFDQEVYNLSLINCEHE